ncbi:MAG TPA: hypothetical protein VMF32_27005 [Xanthobacteraceae bacterium]|nr:hypothetical protein [Xanthobacteraceae bacterium]
MAKSTKRTARTKSVRHDARIFAVGTRFQKMARRPGGVPRDQAIERAQNFIDELKPEFVNWLDRKLQELGTAIQQAEGSSFDVSWHERAYRSSCQLQDVGATMGFELITFVANNLCKILEVIKMGIAYDREIIKCHLDALLLAKSEPYRNLCPEQLPEMTGGLQRVVELLGKLPDREVK